MIVFYTIFVQFSFVMQSYEPAAVTYHPGAANHFVAFHKLGTDKSWHFYDGLEEYHNPGSGDVVITETTISKKLGANSRVGHIVMVRVSMDK